VCFLFEKLQTKREKLASEKRINMEKKKLKSFCVCVGAAMAPRENEN
jgi:hypothetical protein